MKGLVRQPHGLEGFRASEKGCSWPDREGRESRKARRSGPSTLMLGVALRLAAERRFDFFRFFGERFGLCFGDLLLGLLRLYEAEEPAQFGAGSGLVVRGHVALDRVDLVRQGLAGADTLSPALSRLVSRSWTVIVTV